jgi:hypothetical protein
MDEGLRGEESVLAPREGKKSFLSRHSRSAGWYLVVTGAKRIEKSKSLKPNTKKREP